MSRRQEYPIQAMGFWVFGFFSVVLAVLKPTVAGLLVVVEGLVVLGPMHSAA
jgi:hypothetical protein